MSDDENTFTFDELRIALTAFALWLLKGEAGEGSEVELVDRFIAETAASDDDPDDAVPGCGACPHAAHSGLCLVLVDPPEVGQARCACRGENPRPFWPQSPGSEVVS